MNTKKIYVLQRGEPDYNPFRKGANYSGIPYHVRFEPNKDIMLHGLGFAGVDRRSEGSKFLLTLSITESWFKNSFANSGNCFSCICRKRQNEKELEEILSERTFVKEVEPGKEFSIRFKVPVEIPMNLLAEVAFQIDPAIDDKPVTLKKIKSGETKHVMDHEESGVQFEFMNSSNAITELYFSRKRQQ